MFSKKEKVTFKKANAQDQRQLDVTELAEALRSNPGEWFAITSVTFGWDNATQAKIKAILAALESAIHQPGQVEYKAPSGRGYAQVRYLPE